MITTMLVGLVQSVDAVPVWMVLGFNSPMVMLVLDLIPRRMLSPSTMATLVVWTQQYLVVSLQGGLLSIILQGGPMGVEWWLRYIC